MSSIPVRTMSYAFCASLLVAAVVSASAGPDASCPKGWILAGSAPRDYDATLDLAAHAGKGSGRLKSKATDKTAGFGTLMQTFKADQFHGKRVRLTAWVKADKVESWSGVWMRVDGTSKGEMLAFDNMQSRPIKGTSDWTKHQVVLDVAPEAADIAFGILLDGTGTVWIDDISFEIVDKSVATTGSMGQQDLPVDPQNLAFEG